MNQSNNLYDATDDSITVEIDVKVLNQSQCSLIETIDLTTEEPDRIK